MMNRKTSGHQNDLLASVTQIVTTYLRQHELEPEQLAPVITSIAGALRCAFEDEPPSANKSRPLDNLVPAPAAPVFPLPQPAVAIEQSVAHDYLVCLEDGRKVRMLRRYLAGRYGMSPDEYRQKWGLTEDYPMVAPGCAALKRRAARTRVERAVAGEVNGQRLRRAAGADVEGGPEPAASADAALLSPPIRLIKRDQAVSNGHGDAGVELPVGGTVRGRVRWFDAEKDAGEIQLNGWSKVFRIGAEHLRRAGLRRLYRGQEVEAQLVPGADGQLQVVGLQLIGPETEAGDAAALPRSAVVTRRNRRAVTVELKTEALRRVGTRLQAERLFGRGGDLPN